VSRPLTIGDVRLIVADIPVRRPHHMSFTTLTAVNFVFVRAETSDRLVGWGEAACLGGPTWSEESAESVAATIERYLAPWLVGRDPTDVEALRLEMARRVQGNAFARAAVEMALWDLAGRSLGVPVYRLLGGRVRDRVPLSWSLAVADPQAEVEEARERIALGRLRGEAQQLGVHRGDETRWAAQQRCPHPPAGLEARSHREPLAGEEAGGPCRHAAGDDAPHGPRLVQNPGAPLDLELAVVKRIVHGA